MNPNDIFNSFFSSFGGFNNPFSSFFGGRQNTQQAGPRPVNGQSINYTVEISLEESYYGGTKQVEFDKFITCSECNGTGGEYNTCPMCNGSGIQVQNHGFMTVQTTCPQCNGQGKTISKKCTKCNGQGFTKEKELITINIPQGADEGTHLVAHGKGYPGKNGGQNGNAIIIIKLNDKNNNRYNNDFIYSCDVKLSELLCGTKKTIKICKDDITFTIPELYNIQQPIIIHNKGFKDLHSNAKGNLIIQLNLLLPKEKLSDENKQQLRNFEESIY